jgi:molybdopterin-guanine dinucleotide biosynthesis protein B
MAGCDDVLVTSARGYALLGELRGSAVLSLADALARLSPCDLVLVEGFKRAAIPKLEVWREALGKPRLAPADANVDAVASDTPTGLPDGLPVFDLRNIDAIATFVVQNAAACRVRD